MELEYTLVNIEFAKDGRMPRAVIRVAPPFRAPDGTEPDICDPGITIVLPLNDSTTDPLPPFPALRESTVRAARAIVNEQALRDWVAAQG